METDIHTIIKRMAIGADSGKNRKPTDNLPELTDVELQDVVYKARLAKRQDLNKDKCVCIEEGALWKPSPDEYLLRLLENHSWFKLDEQSYPVFELLAWYFTGDERFEECGYSFQKGISLVGPIGCGKTAVLRLFHFNPYASFTEVNCSAVSEQFTKDGFEVIALYGKMRSFSKNGFAQEKRGYLFDDLGTEEERRNYGNTSNVMADVLMRRYSNGLPFQYTHVTSNLDEEGITRMYGPRVASRFFEMFNIIEFLPSAKDRRRQ